VFGGCLPEQPRALPNVETASVPAEELPEFRKPFGNRSRRSLADIAAGTGGGELRSHQREEPLASTFPGTAIREEGLSSRRARVGYRFGRRRGPWLGPRIPAFAMDEDRLSRSPIPAASPGFLNVGFHRRRFAVMDHGANVLFVDAERIRILNINDNLILWSLLI